jgi:hypothetical protein
MRSPAQELDEYLRSVEPERAQHVEAASDGLFVEVGFQAFSR